MENISEQQRVEFSQRLTQELKRIGQPVSSPTKIARAFNKNFSGNPVSAQTVRKWLLSEGMPTQPKLIALAEWLGISAQWLRYGLGPKSDSTITARKIPDSATFDNENNLTQNEMVVKILSQLVQLSPRDIRIIDGLIQMMHSENIKK